MFSRVTSGFSLFTNTSCIKCICLGCIRNHLRMVVSDDICTSMLTGVEFYFEYGCTNKVTDWPRSESVLFQYSNNGGIVLNLLKEIYYPDTNRVRAVIFICHGIGDHCLWYEGLAEALVQIGFYVFTHDHVGQGRSEGAHNHVDSFDEYTSVIFQHCTEVKEKYPALPFFMLGNSVGGTIALLATIQKPCLVQGLIICAPVLMPADGPPSFTSEVVTRLFLGTFFPHLKLFDIEPWRITRDCNMIRKYAEDSMIHHYVKAKWCVAWMNAVMRLEDRMKSIGCPLFILHGDADPISDVKSSHVIYDEVQSLDKEIKIYPGFYHFLLLEQEENREQVFDDIIDWLKRRIQNNSDI